MSSLDDKRYVNCSQCVWCVGLLKDTWVWLTGCLEFKQILKYIIKNKYIYILYKLKDNDKMGEIVSSILLIVHKQ